MREQSGRALTGQALVLSDQAASHLAPSGFDLSRGDSEFNSVVASLVEQLRAAMARRQASEPGSREAVSSFDDIALTLCTYIGRDGPSFGDVIVERLSASGIEAATADETRSGSAEGKSPIGEAETPDDPTPTGVSPLPLDAGRSS